MKINGGRKLPLRLTPRHLTPAFDDLLAAGFPVHEETSDLWFPPSFCLVLIAALQTNIAATAYRDVGATDLRDGYLSAYAGPSPTGRGLG